MKNFITPTAITSATPEFLVGCLFALYSMHTSGEKGLESNDVQILTSIVTYLHKQRSLTERQLSLLRMKLRRYTVILSMINVDVYVPKRVEIRNVEASTPQIHSNVLLCSTVDANTLRLDFQYDESLIARVKSLPGRRYHNTNSKDKHWTVPASIQNIRAVMNMGFTIPKQFSNLLSSAKLDFNGLKMELRPYQLQGAERAAGELNLRCLIADEPGCVAGSTEIVARRCRATWHTTIKEFYSFFKRAKERKVEYSIYVRALKDEAFGPHEVQDVVYSGRKHVLRLVLQSGKELLATPDHEILTPTGYVELRYLQPGMSVLTNGKLACPECGSTDNIVTHKYAQFYGYCRSCMYHLRRSSNKKGFSIDKDGYKHLVGRKYYRHPNYKSRSGLLEHHFVMSNHIGRPIKKNEAVHHKDGNKLNNDISNLELLSAREHGLRHIEKRKHFHTTFVDRGRTIVMVPLEDVVVSVSHAGVTDTYDIVMKDPYRNFIANGIIVHNCGKTCQFLAAIWSRRKEAFPAAIVCPNSVKWNWAKEVKMWLPDVSIRMLEGLPKRTSFKCRDKNELVIINYDVLADRGSKSGWAKLLKEAGIQTIGFDECHKLKNPKTQRTQSVLDMCEPIPFRIGLSGTPIESRPIEFYTMLNLVDPGLFPNIWEFATRYCGYTKSNHDMSGATNTKELNDLLTNGVMIRRRKADVLKELPPKIISVIPVAIDMREYNKRMEALVSYTQELEGKSAGSAEGLALIERCKQAAAVGKLQAAIEWCENYLDSGKKLVVFAWHAFVLNALEKAFSGVSVRVDGSTKPKDRQSAVNSFQKDDRIRLFIGNLQAAGEGITLTAASDTLTLELAWTPSKHDQASDRTHRVGQTASSVTAYYMLAKGTIEEDIMELLDNKRRVLSQVLDGEEAQQASLLTELMKRIKAR